MDSEKKQKMNDSSYQYDEDLECFVNRADGKIFSEAWVADQNMNTIQISLNIPHQASTWKLFLKPDQPHEEIRNTLFAKYGKTP